MRKYDFQMVTDGNENSPVALDAKLHEWSSHGFEIKGVLHRMGVTVILMQRLCEEGDNAR